jgi:hypothetical protein
MDVEDASVKGTVGSVEVTIGSIDVAVVSVDGAAAEPKDPPVSPVTALFPHATPISSTAPAASILEVRTIVRYSPSVDSDAVRFADRRYLKSHESR